MGLREDQACVEIDNAGHVRFYDGGPRNVATLAVERADRWRHKALPSRTLRRSMLHALHDEANHQGEIYLLKKVKLAAQ